MGPNGMLLITFLCFLAVVMGGMFGFVAGIEFTIKEQRKARGEKP